MTKLLRYLYFMLLLASSTMLAAQAPKATAHISDQQRLIGAWHLVAIHASEADSNNPPAALPQGMLIYTEDGHMSVQLMYPESAHVPANQYVYDGYEASFGTYTVDPAAHTLTHHVQGSITRAKLVGKDLPRLYSFTSDGHLIVRSADPAEHWAVIWQHD